LKHESQYGEDGTQMINWPDSTHYTELRPPELRYNQLFVYVDFIKPGKHSYIVSYEKNHVEPEVEEPVEPPKLMPNG